MTAFTYKHRVWESLEEWQASAATPFRETKADVLLTEQFSSTYARRHNDIWRRLIRLHGTLFSLEILDQFPFDRVYAPDRMHFWALVVENFLDQVVLLFSTLVVDDGKDTNTLNRLKNDIVRAEWRDPKLCESFRESLREHRFDTELRDVLLRVEGIRDARIAHRILNLETGLPSKAIGGIGLDEFVQLFRGVHRLFGAISFGSSYVTLGGDYIPGRIGGDRTRSTIEDVLDLVARQSGFVTAPEHHGEFWPGIRTHRDPNEITAMNSWRLRLGLPEA